MPREKEKTGKLDRQSIKFFRMRLKAIDGILAVAEDASKEGEVWSFKIPSLITGIEKLEAASDELKKSLSAIAAGDPYGPRTQKTYAVPVKKKTTNRKAKRR